MVNQLVSFAVFFFLVYAIFKYVIKDRLFLWSILLCLKLLAGLTLGLIYDSYYQGGDTWNYHHDALLLMNNPIQEEMATLRFHEEPRALFFSRIVACLHWFTNGNYWISGLYLSLLSFMGSFYFVKTLVFINSKYFIPSFASVFAFPSLVFWSSGVMKESLVLPSFLIALAVLFKMHHNLKLKPVDLILLAISLILLTAIKYYILALLLVSFVPFMVEKYIFPSPRIKLKWLKVNILTLCIWLAFLFIGPFLHPNFSSEHLLPNLVDSYQQNSAATKGNLSIEFKNLDAHWLSVFQNAPKAVFSGIFRPFIWEISTPFQLIVASENVLFTILFLIFLIQIKNLKPEVFHFCLLLFIVMASVFFTIANPNLGTLSRIRIFYIFPLIFILTSVIFSNIENWSILVSGDEK